MSTSQQHPKPTTTEPGRRSPPCALVIFGASGDLTARKLLPALERLAPHGALSAEVGLIGVARTPMTDEEFSRYCRKAVAGTDNVRWAELVANARYVHGGYDDPATYARLADVQHGDRGRLADGGADRQVARVRDSDQARQPRPCNGDRRRIRRRTRGLTQ